MDIKKVLSVLTRGSDKIVATREGWHDGDYIYVSGAGMIYDDAGNVAVLRSEDILADDWYACEKDKTYVSETVYKYALGMKDLFGVDSMSREDKYLYFSKDEDIDNSIAIPLDILKKEIRDELYRLWDDYSYDIGHLAPFKSGK